MIPAPYSTPPPAPPVSTTPPPPFSPYPAHDYYQQLQQRDLRTQIDRTKTGLLLLIIGLILASLPIVGFIGAILDLIGAILVILGRKGFGPLHARNTILSLVLYIAGGVVGGVGLVALTFSFIGSSISGTAIDQAALANAFYIFLVTLVVGGIIQGLAIVLFTYALQKQTGKILLWVGYAISVAISAVVAIFIFPLVSNAVASAIATNSYAPLRDLQSEADAFQILGIIPAVIFALAYYMGRERIERGELPAPQQPQQPTPPSPMPTGY